MRWMQMKGDKIRSWHSEDTGSSPMQLQNCSVVQDILLRHVYTYSNSVENEISHDMIDNLGENFHEILY
jgi:hypothetical protein